MISKASEKMRDVFPTSLHANEAAPCVEGHTVDEPRCEKRHQDVERSVGSRNVFLEVLHGS